MSRHWPEPPLLEFQFLFLGDGRSYAHRFIELTAFGTFAGTIWIQESTGPLATDWASIREAPLRSVPMQSTRDIVALASDQRRRIMQVEAYGVVSESTASPDIVTVVSTRTRRPDLEHPFAVWGDGSAFSGPSGDQDFQARQERAFTGAIEAFTRLLVLQPGYAALTLGERLPPPAELAEDQFVGFKDFYVRDDLLADAAVSRAATEFGSIGNVKPVHGGLLVTTSHTLIGTPHIAREVQSLSIVLGRALGRASVGLR